MPVQCLVVYARLGKIRVKRPRSRGGYRHKYYCHKLQEFAETTWPGSMAEIEDGSLGKYADVIVRMPTGPDQARQRVIAFEVFMTGEAKEIRGIAKGVEVFDQIIVCAETQEALDSLRNKALDALGSTNLAKVSFNLVSQYLSPNQAGDLPNTLPAKPGNQPVQQPLPLTSSDNIPPHTPALTRVKNRAKPEAEVKSAAAPAIRRGRKPKAPLMVQVEEAFVHIHDLDWLQDCELTKLPGVQERVQPRHTMPEAMALRSLLLDAAKQVISDMGTIPDKAGVIVFLERYLEGKSNTDIAEELGVSRQWVSTAYRREAFSLAGMQFVRSVSIGS